MGDCGSCRHAKPSSLGDSHRRLMCEQLSDRASFSFTRLSTGAIGTFEVSFVEVNQGSSQPAPTVVLVDPGFGCRLHQPKEET
jgi:hypothetical protein